MSGRSVAIARATYPPSRQRDKVPALRAPTRTRQPHTRRVRRVDRVPAQVRDPSVELVETYPRGARRRQTMKLVVGRPRPAQRRLRPRRYDQLFAGVGIAQHSVLGIPGFPCTQLMTESDRDIRGVSIAGQDHRPGIGANTRHHRNAHPFGLRFTLAHELCHVLFDRHEGRRLAIASGPWAPCSIEKRANAFAAMLLMPPPLIERAVERLTYPIDSSIGVREAAHVLEAGVASLLHHLRNTGFITETDRERIEDELFAWT